MSGRLSLTLLVLAACARHPREAATAGGTVAPAKLDAGGARRPTGEGRPAELACNPERPPGNSQPGNWGCHSDAECSQHPSGRCRSGFGRRPMNTCTFDECVRDADCHDGGPCECGFDGNHCLRGNCKTDADCGAAGAGVGAGVCGRSQPESCGRGMASYFCRSARDTCASDPDCNRAGDRLGLSQQCVYDEAAGHFGCQKPSPCPPG